MKTAGIREARQNLSRILEEVRKGREVVLTDRGRPVARLVPSVDRSARPFTSHGKLRGSVKLKGKPLSATIESEREDRI